MSLKVIHVFFILTAIVLTFSFGAWAIRDFWYGSRELLRLTLGLLSLAGGGFLIFYLSWFRRKLKRQGLSS